MLSYLRVIFDIIRRLFSLRGTVERLPKKSADGFPGLDLNSG